MRCLSPLFAALLLGSLATVAATAAQFPRDALMAERNFMVAEQIERRGVTDARVLAAMREVPRHLFVPEARRGESYEDWPLPIGEGQTISQPYIVALMTSLLEPEPGDKVLEIGTGSGYQAAVLSRLVREVYSIEILEPLGRQAERSLAAQGYRNVKLRIGDGYQGWPEEAPFDGIIVTAAAPSEPPRPLLDQLKVGGKMVVPVGRFFQDLLVITKSADGIEKRTIIPVRFVPMTGEVQKHEPQP